MDTPPAPPSRLGWDCSHFTKRKQGTVDALVSALFWYLHSLHKKQHRAVKNIVIRFVWYVLYYPCGDRLRSPRSIPMAVNGLPRRAGVVFACLSGTKPLGTAPSFSAPARELLWVSMTGQTSTVAPETHPREHVHTRTRPTPVAIGRRIPRSWFSAPSPARLGTGPGTPIRDPREVCPVARVASARGFFARPFRLSYARSLDVAVHQPGNGLRHLGRKREL